MFEIACILAVMVLLLLSGFYSGAETAITSANKVYIHHRASLGNVRARIAEQLLSRTELFLGTTLVGTNLANVSATTLAETLVAHSVSGNLESIINTLLMTPLVLILGELLPKSLGRAHADEISLKIARPLQLSSFVFYPVIKVTSSISQVFAGPLGAKYAAARARVTREDVRTIAEMAAEEGLLSGPAGSMLRTVFDLDSKPVSAVMIPFVDVSSIPHEATVTELEKLSVKTGFTRFPVYAGRRNNVIGVVDLRNLLCRPEQWPEKASEDTTVGEVLESSILFVPETKAVGALLHELRYHRVPMAVVVDEHGTISGIVTTEDLIEEVVGEIHDERDRPAQDVRKVGTGVYECTGNLELDHLETVLGIEIEHPGFETVAGLVLKLAGYIPQAGERFRFGKYDVEVRKVVHRRVAAVRFIEREPPADPR